MLRHTLFACAASLALASPAAAQLAASPDQLATTPLVTVQISEQLRSAPDEATISVGVTSRAPTAKAALTKNQAEMTKVMAVIRAAGIPDRHIQTDGVSLSADYRYETVNGVGEQKMIGYQAGNTVRVKTSDIDKLPDLLDRLASAGANSIYGPSFAIGDPLPIRARAKKQAMDRGLAEAREFARNAGFADVQLLSVQDSVSYRGTDMVVTGLRQMSVAAPAPPPPMPERSGGGIAPGQIETGVTLTLLYRMIR
ncbi:MAG: SIMPL domain-containing protein [Sphingomicrobium sp.]